jgi:hypothetical protein
LSELIRENGPSTPGNRKDYKPLHDIPPRMYSAHFFCTGLIKDETGIREHNEFQVVITFPYGYLREAIHPSRIVFIRNPLNVFHPNIRGPIIELDRLEPGTGLVEILYRVFDVLTHHPDTWNLAKPVNKEACEWVKIQPVTRFPVDNRPLRWRKKRYMNT